MDMKQMLARKLSSSLGRSAKKDARKEKGVIGAPPLPKELQLQNQK